MTREQDTQPIPQEESGALVPGTVVGDYVIDGVLGEGGMAVVYAATHSVLGRRTAIKVLSPGRGNEAVSSERFIQEARALARLEHPNIVSVFDFGDLPGGRQYFVMERLEGESLRDRLAPGPLPVAQVVHLAQQIVDALEVAHAAGIVHRDLKPSNIFLARTGNTETVKLLDFGIAKLLGEAGKNLTQTGLVVGTPNYIAPEQARNQQVSIASDLYGLGALLFEMTLGRPVFDRPSGVDTLLAHAQDTPPALHHVWPQAPRVLSDLVSSLLAKEPEERPRLPDVRSTLVELEKTPARLVYHPGTTTKLAGAAQRGSRLVKPLAAGATIAVAAVAVVLALSSPSQPAPAEPPAAPTSAAEPEVSPPPVAESESTAKSRAPRTKKRVERFGFLSVRAKPWVRVSANGKQIAAETPVKRRRVSAGEVVLLFENPALGFRAKKKVRIRPDRELRLFVDVSEGTIRME